MSDKDSKAPIYIAIVVAIILIAAGGYYVLGGKITPVKTDNGKQTPPVTTAKQTAIGATTPGKITASQTPAVTPAPVKVETIKCELCHKESQDLTPHLNGGKLCVTCHGSQVHNIHIGTGTVGM